MAWAQTNGFVARDDVNQVPRDTPKSGNVILNDDNPDNLSNSDFEVRRVMNPTQGTLALNPDGSYIYTPNAGYTGPDSFTYQICQPGATPLCSASATVVLNIYDPANVCTLGTGRNLLQNPSFTQGRTGFAAPLYTYVDNPAVGLYGEGTYTVADDASTYHNNFEGMGRTGAGDNFMIVNGAKTLQSVYEQDVTVLPNRYYSFSVYAVSVNSQSPAQLGLVVGGKSTSVVTTLPTTTGEYVYISDLYFSGPGPTGGPFTVKVEIVDVNKERTGNDFGIDDLYFGSCSAFLLADTKTTGPVPNTAGQPTSILPLSATISTSGSTGVTVASFTIQSLPTAGTLRYNGGPVTVGQMIPVASLGSLNSGGSLTYTPVGGCASASLTFTYTATDSDGNGSNNTATYTIPVVPASPPRIRARGGTAFCPGERVRLSTDPRPGYLFTWYNGPTIVNGAGAVLNDTVFFATATGDYTVKSELAACSAVSNVLTLTLRPPLIPGSIGADQSVCLGATPAPLTSLAGASGGQAPYSYQWESSPDNITWTIILSPNATGIDYAPGPVMATTYYRRRASSANGNCPSAASNTVAVTIAPAVMPGAIGADQTICTGTAPAPLTSLTGASGGSGGSYAYQWQSSPDNATWTTIATATGADYAPGPLTTTTYYRRGASAATNGCAPIFTAAVRITVSSLVAPGSIGPNQTICTGNTPARLTSLGGASGGTGPYTYQWQNSTDNLTWLPIPNATGTEYAPGPLTVTTHYRRLASPAIGNCLPTPTGAVTVTVSPVLTPGAIGAGQLICTGVTPAPLTSLAGAGGGQGPYAYQWERSPDNTTWTPIANATGADYAPGPLTTTTYYRRLASAASSGCTSVASTAVRLEVSPLINVEAGPDKEIVEGQGGQVELEGRANGNFPVVWTPTRGLSFANGDPLRPLASPGVTTVYTLSAGPPGCGDESRVKVTVLPPVRIPNAFTPNGDGRDDTWEIDRIGDFPGNTVTVFNRWGNEVFKITNYNRGNEWSGKISGQPAPVGTYYYVVTLGNGKSYSGPLTVLY